MAVRTDEGSGREADLGFAPWARSWVLRLLLVRWELSGACVGAICFATYWIVPLAFSLIDGTAITQEAAQSLKQNWLPLHTHIALLDQLFDRLIAAQKLHGAAQLAYLQDRTHFLFAAIVSIGVWISVVLFRKLQQNPQTLMAQGLFVDGPTQIVKRYEHYRRRAYGPTGILFGAFMSIGTFIAFIAFSHSPNVAHWWGYAGYGSAGTAFALAIAFVIFWGCRGLFIIGNGSLMVGKLCEFPVVFRPFHPDGCNGFAPVGEIVVLLWLDSLALLLTIFVTMHFGYLEIERTPVAWGSAIVGIGILPVFVAYPLFKAHHALLAARTRALESLEPAMMNLHASIEGRLRSAHGRNPDLQLPVVDNAEGLFNTLSNANVWPFHRNVTAAIFIANVLQLLLLARAIFGGNL
jgi:hypothetical protein